MSKTKKTATKRGPQKFEATQDAYANFVKVWQESDNKNEVVIKTGLTAGKVSAWSYNLRNKGVPLKKFKTRPELNIKELTEIAKKSIN